MSHEFDAKTDYGGRQIAAFSRPREQRNEIASNNGLGSTLWLQ